MNAIDRKTYTKLLQAAGDDLTDHITEGTNISVIQWINRNGEVVLQAVYHQPVKGQRVCPKYYKT